LAWARERCSLAALKRKLGEADVRMAVMHQTAFLEAGTPVYQVNGQAPAAQLAAGFRRETVVTKLWR